MATVGLVFSVLSGVVYVNLAIRFGWLSRVGGSVEKVELIQGVESRHAPEVIALGRVRPEVVDPLVFQVLIVGAAFGLGYLMKEAVSWSVNPASRGTEQVVADAVPSAVDSDSSEGGTQGARRDAAKDELNKRTSLAGTIGGMPLFIYTLFGGLIVRQLLQRLALADLIDHKSIDRISGCAMDFLIVAAIATLRLEAIAGLAAPLAILIAAAFVWTGFCLLFVAKRLLPADYWFQLGILNYGMSTGTTATGFTLLKIVDKDLDSGAAEDYALAAPMSSPFIGGGMVTVGLPLLVLENVPIAISTIALAAVVAALYMLGRRLAHS
jgi:ESS family glutamate:Na+ symporter